MVKVRGLSLSERCTVSNVFHLVGVSSSNALGCSNQQHNAMMSVILLLLLLLWCCSPVLLLLLFGAHART